MKINRRGIALGLSFKLFLAMMLMSLMMSVAFTLNHYVGEKNSIIRGIDNTLLATAEGVRLIGDAVHHRQPQPDAITPDAYAAFIDTLTAFAKRAKVQYVYTTIKQDDHILFTSSSYTPEEKASGDFTKFLDPYDDASDGLQAAFADGQVHDDQYSDRWGTFRSIFVPATSSTGIDYVIGVDVSLGRHRRDLARNLARIAPDRGRGVQCGATAALAADQPHDCQTFAAGDRHLRQDWRGRLQQPHRHLTPR